MDFGPEASSKYSIAVASGVGTASKLPRRLKRLGGAYALSLLGLTCLYAILMWIQVGRPLWFDELLTFYIARAQSVGRVLHLVRRWDLNPPTLHLLVHYSMALFGTNAGAARLPSMLGFYGASVSLFWYTARKAGVAYAAIPVLILWYSPFFFYATEARPYALLCFWFCALLLCWDSKDSSKARAISLCGIAICSAGLISSHVFGCLSLFPFLAAELIVDSRRRRIDWLVWAALLVPLIGVTGYIPLYEDYKQITFYPPAFQASYKQIVFFYEDAGQSIWPLLCATLAIALITKKAAARTSRLSSVRLQDLVIPACVALNPILVNLLLMHGHGAFWPRYCITTMAAFYLLFAFFLAFTCDRRELTGYAASAAVALLLIFQSIGMPLYLKLAKREFPPNAAFLANIRPDLPIVAASGMTFIEMGHYEPSSILSRLYYLRDRNAAIRYAHATMYEDLDQFVREFHLPGTVESYNAFVREHHDFLVLGTFDYPEDWLLKKLTAEDADIHLVGVYRIPYKDTHLYEVRLKSAAP